MLATSSVVEPALPFRLETGRVETGKAEASSAGTTGLGGATILIVDDEESFREMLRDLLARGGYRDVLMASSGEEALRVIGEISVDLLLTDMQMPGRSGLELLADVRASSPRVATLMITARDDTTLAEEALALGAYGYFVKPFRHTEVLIGISNALRRRTLELEDQGHRAHLENQVKIRTAHLWEALKELATSERDVLASRAETFERLAAASEFRDEETGQHVTRMSRFCEALARAAGADAALQDVIREAASLHDIGKIGIPDSILLKPESLSPEERLVLQHHAEIGYRILAGSDAPVLKLAAEIALTHHERIDGSGYPNGLTGDSIPLSGRIAAIADVFDALTTNRVYRPAYDIVATIDIMKSDGGSHFDPELLDKFWDVLPEILDISAASRATPSTSWRAT